MRSSAPSFKQPPNHKKAWLVSVNMGYGHDRAAYGMEELAYGDIISANDYEGIPEQDKKMWVSTRTLYEHISRLQPIPILGNALFGAMDYLQRIKPFYPRRDLSKPTLQLKQIYYLIRHRNLARHLIQKLSQRHLPLVSTFPTPAFAAEEHNYPGEIFLVICDADCSRSWAPLDPKRSRIKYLASNGRVVERLKLYGVRPEQIFLTGFPLPKKLVGGSDSSTVKEDLKARICNLDPNGVFINKYQNTLEANLGWANCQFKKKHPLTLTFSVGGAGAQKHLGVELIRSLRRSLLAGDIRVNLEVGTREPIAAYFHEASVALGLEEVLGNGLNIHYYQDRPTYFRQFIHTLKTSDILWTKPSELSFYCGVGLPIIMAPPIGSQELFNKKWLETVNAGTMQMDTRYVNEWLFDWVHSGALARFAWNGYIEAPTHGTYRIENIVTGTMTPLEDLPLIV